MKRHDIAKPVEIVYGDENSIHKFKSYERTYVITDGMLSNFSSPMSQAMCKGENFY